MKYKSSLDTVYNDLVAIINNEKANLPIRKHARLLLDQLVTAGGKELMGQEAINWVNQHSKYITTLN